MMRFIGGLATGLIVGFFLGMNPAISRTLTEIGQMLAFSALATLL